MPDLALQWLEKFYVSPSAEVQEILGGHPCEVDEPVGEDYPFETPGLQYGLLVES